MNEKGLEMYKIINNYQNETNKKQTSYESDNILNIITLLIKLAQNSSTGLTSNSLTLALPFDPKYAEMVCSIKN